MEQVKERERLTGHLEKLRVTRGKKRLDGKSVTATNTAIRQTEGELEGLDDAAREAERRAQIEAKERRATERSNAKAELQVTREEIVTATNAAHAAAQELVKQLCLIPELYEQARIKTVALGERVSADWGAFEVVSRYGWRIGSLFSTISERSRNRLGPIHWSLHSTHPSTEIWGDRESKILGLENDK